jgi:hypothetical protein
MPGHHRAWRFTFWAALVPAAILGIAAGANIFFAYGLVAPGGHFICWCGDNITVGKNPSFDSFEFFADTRPQWTTTDHGSSQWLYVSALANHRVDIPAWLAPLPALGLCILAFKMTRTPPFPRCRHCGYDLRGLSRSPASPLTCPECGRPSPPPGAVGA